MKNPQNTLSGKMLLSFFKFTNSLPHPFEYKPGYVKRFQTKKNTLQSCYNTLSNLKRRGLIKIFKVGERKYLELTKKGALEALFIKGQLQKAQKWDGKWRMIVFDIPEDTRDKRDKLRFLLKANGYKLIQRSVFLNPYPLNREAIKYLNDTGLHKYIRIFRIDDTDNDADLKRKFGLT